jgi:hypothetical protein
MIATLASYVPLLALEGEPTGWAAIAFVLWWVVMLMGSMYALLWSIYGAKQALHVLMAATWGFMILYSAIWLFGAPGTPPGTGPRGREPAWVPFLATSAQAQDFGAVKKFPEGWDTPKAGQKYAGGIEPAGEVNNIKAVWEEALSRRAATQGTPATDPANWEFRTTPTAASAEEASLKFAQVYFKVDGSHLITGVTIPATDKHPEVTVFAYRDKGQVFYWAAIALGVAIVLFAAHIFALSQMEKRQQLLQTASA